MVSTNRKKSLNERILFQVNRKSVSTSRNAEFAYKYVSTRGKNCIRQEYLKIQKKLLSIAVIRVLNRPLYNLNNGFH